MIKKIFTVTILLSFLCISAISQTIITGTFNLRYDNPRDSGNLWKDRSPVAAALIRFHQFDIVGTQEGLRNQLDDLQKSLPEYAWYGIGRDNGQNKGEYSAIFYKKEKFNVIDSGDFWLSEHPERPGFGWDARNNRICSWIKLKEKSSKKSFYIFNVHYDHRGLIARKESSKLIMQKIQSIAGNQPVLLTGDFNGNHQSEWYTFINNSNLLKDALLQVNNPYINNGSFNSFQSNNPSNDIIDHIFISKDFRVKRYGILTDTYHGRFPSDHYPVLAELVLKK
ncbi:MAG TPA: endonuclease/exonuclease/phosphatase family protein [Chitinophagaceae bacterium]|nr:endonuclease/exonuclease/phosphatase family protein [Chitinophagaceae bacterium]